MKTTFGSKPKMLEFREAGGCSKVNLTSTIVPFSSMLAWFS